MMRAVFAVAAFVVSLTLQGCGPQSTSTTEATSDTTTTIRSPASALGNAKTAATLRGSPPAESSEEADVDVDDYWKRADDGESWHHAPKKTLLEGGKNADRKSEDTLPGPPTVPVSADAPSENVDVDGDDYWERAADDPDNWHNKPKKTVMDGSQNAEDGESLKTARTGDETSKLTHPEGAAESDRWHSHATAPEDDTADIDVDDYWQRASEDESWHHRPKKTVMDGGKNSDRKSEDTAPGPPVTPATSGTETPSSEVDVDGDDYWERANDDPENWHNKPKKTLLDDIKNAEDGDSSKTAGARDMAGDAELVALTDGGGSGATDRRHSHATAPEDDTADVDVDDYWQRADDEESWHHKPKKTLMDGGKNSDKKSEDTAPGPPVAPATASGADAPSDAVDVDGDDYWERANEDPQNWHNKPKNHLRDEEGVTVTTVGTSGQTSQLTHPEGAAASDRWHSHATAPEDDAADVDVDDYWQRADDEESWHHKPKKTLMDGGKNSDKKSEDTAPGPPAVAAGADAQSNEVDVDGDDYWERANDDPDNWHHKPKKTLMDGSQKADEGNSPKTETNKLTQPLGAAATAPEADTSDVDGDDYWQRAEETENWHHKPKTHTIAEGPGGKNSENPDLNKDAPAPAPGADTPSDSKHHEGKHDVDDDDYGARTNDESEKWHHVDTMASASEESAPDVDADEYWKSADDLESENWHSRPKKTTLENNGNGQNAEPSKHQELVSDSTQTDDDLETPHTPAKGTDAKEPEEKFQWNVDSTEAWLYPADAPKTPSDRTQYGTSAAEAAAAQGAYVSKETEAEDDGEPSELVEPPLLPAHSSLQTQQTFPSHPVQTVVV